MGAGWGPITPISAANNCDGGPGIWDWFTNVGTPNGNSNGFFFLISQMEILRITLGIIVKEMSIGNSVGNLHL